MRTIVFFLGLLAFVSRGTGQINVNNIDATNWDVFNCVRPTGVLPCNGNGACQPDGDCVCNGGFTGFDCSVSNTGGAGFVDVSLCATGCENGGSCYRPDATLPARCYCPAEYTGTNCSQARVFVVCDTGDMVVDVYPQGAPGSFRGFLAVQKPGTTELRTEPACVALSSETFSYNNERIQTSFSTDSDPGQNACQPDMELVPLGNGNSMVCYELRLVYSPFGIVAASDEVFKICCNEQSSLNGDSVIVGTEGDNTGSAADVNGTVQIITSDLVYSGTNTPVGGATVNVGDKLAFVVNFVDASVRYDDLRVISCTAFPDDIPLIAGRCPNPYALSIVRNITSTPGEVRIEIWAFRPSSNTAVTLSCDIEVCDIACPAVATCSGTNIQGYGRKKRQAGDDPGETEVITTKGVFNIYVEPAPQESCPKEECGIMKEVFLPVAIVFGVLLLAVLGVATFLCFRQSNGRNSKATA